MPALKLSLQGLHELAVRILTAHRTTADIAYVVATAITSAEADGQVGHGASRLPLYAAQAQSGKVDGTAHPEAQRVGPAAVRVDARGGFAFPAIALAVEELTKIAPETGLAAAAIAQSHHSGVAGQPVEALARKGLIGLFFSNGPKAITPWGGTEAVFSTNPIAFSAPRRGNDPLVIDMSLSKVARGKINAAAQRGEAIPDDCALDSRGQPTTDPAEALAGTMLPMGDAKGAQLVLMVEILAAALSASHFGFEADSFFSSEGRQPRVGHFLIAIDPDGLSQNRFGERLEVLLAAIQSQTGTRLPGERRYECRRKAQRDGVTIEEPLSDQLLALADKATFAPE